MEFIDCSIDDFDGEQNVLQNSLLEFCNKMEQWAPFFKITTELKDIAVSLQKILAEMVSATQLILVLFDEKGHLRDFIELSKNGSVCQKVSLSPYRQYLFKIFAMIRENGKIDPALTKNILLDLQNIEKMYSLAYSSEERGRTNGFFLLVRNEFSGTWSSQERQIVSCLAEIVCDYFSNRNIYEDQALHSFVFNTMMDAMNAQLYVTDIETDEILFMNKSMKKAYHIEHPEGQICWKVLQSEAKERCKFCPKKTLGKNGNKLVHVWEEENTVTGRTYENYDRLITWTDGSTVHIQQSIDITEFKELSKTASMDELTNMFNRRAGKEFLEKTLVSAAKENVPVCVAMYDLNGLKQINDQFGHLEGDRALLKIASTVKKHLDEKAYPFRLSGDEFVVVFYDLKKEDAAPIMEQIRKELKAQKDYAYQLGFCYGLIQINPEDSFGVADVISKADEKMYEQKRRFHIENTEKALSDCGMENFEDTEFNYDKNLLYDALVTSTDDYLYVCNMKTGTFRYPKAMVEEFNLPAQVVHNAAIVWGEKVHKLDKQAFMESNQDIVDGRTDIHCVEYRAKNRKGEWVWLRCRGHLERDKSGEPSLFAGFITNLEKKNKIDHRTGLFNKFEFEDEIKRIISRPGSVQMGVMLVDIDDFNYINSLYNREIGDEVLRIIAQKIQTFLTEEERVYRLDGDEFGILVHGGLERMHKIYKKIQSAFQYQQMYNDKKYYCTFSAGGVVYPNQATDYLNLMKCVGYTLEYSKISGKNRFTLFSQEILLHNMRELGVMEKLRESIEHNLDGFTLFYQPQVEALTGKVVGAEALARWQCDTFGAVSPLEFIPLLERSGLIIQVGKGVIWMAACQCRKWIEKNPDFVMSVNLSYPQLAQEDCIDYLVKVVKETGLEPRNMVIELTESCLAKDGGMVKLAFEKMRALGFKVAMDDFGTGYSSLEMLKDSPADIVKIDKTFIRDIMKSSFDATFIRFIVALCHDVGIQVCLEGVETVEEYEIVKPMGLDTIQGYFFGKPLSSEEFETKFFKNKNTKQEDL